MSNPNWIEESISKGLDKADLIAECLPETEPADDPINNVKMAFLKYIKTFPVKDRTLDFVLASYIYYLHCRQPAIIGNPVFLLQATKTIVEIFEKGEEV